MKHNGPRIRFTFYDSRLTALTVLLIILSACSSSYHPQGVLGDGFSDEKLDPVRWLVHFAASAFTPRDRIETYLLFRCAEIARANESRYFVVSPTGGAAGGPTRPGLIDSPNWGRGDGSARPGSRHREETVLLQLFRTRKPEGYPTIYETADVFGRLEAQVKR